MKSLNPTLPPDPRPGHRLRPGNLLRGASYLLASWVAGVLVWAGAGRWGQALVCARGSCRLIPGAI